MCTGWRVGRLSGCTHSQSERACPNHLFWMCARRHLTREARTHACAGRESIAAKLTANLITEAGVDRVLAMDLHSGQCVGYFDIPVDHVYGETVILDYLASKRIASGDLVVVSPDVGGVARWVAGLGLGCCGGIGRAAVSVQQGGIAGCTGGRTGGVMWWLSSWWGWALNE